MARLVLENGLSKTCVTMRSVRVLRILKTIIDTIGRAYVIAREFPIGSLISYASQFQSSKSTPNDLEVLA